MTPPRIAVLLVSALSMTPLCSIAAGPPDSAALMQAQSQAMQPLDLFDGTWRGPAKITSPDGKEIQITQTERVGSFLGGTVKMIEGRGYAADGSVPFNALAVISYSPQTSKYDFRSYAQGYSGDFAMEVRADGFAWTLPAGPAILRYTASVKDGVWTEVGERIVEGQPPVRVFEMKLQRLGTTDWPQGGAVQAK